jgi:hypothetical protein
MTIKSSSGLRDGGAWSIVTVPENLAIAWRFEPVSASRLSRAWSAVVPPPHPTAKSEQTNRQQPIFQFQAQLCNARIAKVRSSIICLSAVQIPVRRAALNHRLKGRMSQVTSIRGSVHLNEGPRATIEAGSVSRRPPRWVVIAMSVDAALDQSIHVDCGMTCVADIYLMRQLSPLESEVVGDG